MNFPPYHHFIGSFKNNYDGFEICSLRFKPPCWEIAILLEIFLSMPATLSAFNLFMAIPFQLRSSAHKAILQKSPDPYPVVHQ